MEVTLKISVGFWSLVPIAGETMMTDMGEVLVRLLPYFTYLVNTKGNHKKVFSSTCCHLLLPCLTLKALLSKKGRNIGGERSHGMGKVWISETLLEGLDGVVLSLFSRYVCKCGLSEHMKTCVYIDVTQDLVFILFAQFCCLPHCCLVLCLRDYLADYSSALTSSQSTKENSLSTSGGTATKSPVSSVRVLFEVLEEFLKGDDEIENERILSGVLNSLPFILRSFLSENR